MCRTKFKSVLSRIFPKKTKIIYESDDKATFIPNSKLREMSPAEIQEKFHELVNEIKKLCRESQE